MDRVGQAGETDKVAEAPRDHGCFGCGDDNPCGLRLRFATTGPGAVEAVFVPRVQDEGFFGVVHGGIVTAMLDEAMAWATVAADAWAMTARIEVRFHRPVKVGAELRILGRVVRKRGRLVETAGEVRSLDGNVLAEATASFLAVEPGRAAAWRERYGGPASGGC